LSYLKWLKYKTAKPLQNAPGDSIPVNGSHRRPTILKLKTSDGQ